MKEDGVIEDDSVSGQSGVGEKKSNHVGVRRRFRAFIEFNTHVVFIFGVFREFKSCG